MNSYILKVQSDPIYSLIAIVSITIAILFTSRVFRQSTVISFLFAGVLVGQYCLNLLPSGLTTSSPLGELSISFLLFVVGLELDASTLNWKDKRKILMGVIQVFSCSILLCLMFYLSGYSFINAFRIGLLTSMSSTAVVLKVLEERGDSHSPFAINATTVLIVQDLFAVILMAVMALPADLNSTEDLMKAGKDFLKIIIFVPVLYAVSRFLLPRLLRAIVQQKEPELFMFVLLILVIGSSTLGHYLCGSAAMGAFVAGFALAGSPMAYQIRSDIDPFKQVLLSIFFLMIGSSFNIFILETHWQIIIIFLILIPLLKTIGNFFAMIVTKNEYFSGFRTAITLSQIGEFSLLLALIAYKTGWLSVEKTQCIFAVAIVSMGVTPMMIKLSGSDFVKKIFHRISPNRVLENNDDNTIVQAIIVGFGIAGQRCAELLDQMQIHYSVVDQNTKTIEQLKEKNICAIFGDAARHEILEAAGIEHAKFLIIAVPSSVDRLSITCEGRLLNEKVKIIVRSHFLKEATFLQEVGANKVISEEETVSIALSNILREEVSMSPQ